MSGDSIGSLSFAGCGFLGLYHVGVAACFRQYAPLSASTVICGASAGALAAMALSCQLPLGESTSELLSVAIKARARALGPFHPSFDVNKIISDGLIKTLPEDAHKLATGRLKISVTRVSDGQNVLIDKFDSKEDLIRAIQCSCFIPFWSGIVPPKFHGVAYMDGGFSDNLPIINGNTVTVSPFSGESDICPQDDTYNLFQINLVNTSISFSPSNLYRLTRILFPAHPEILSQMCQQGFDDALRYLQRNNKIACTRCLAIQSSFTIGDDIEILADDDCGGSDSGCDNSFPDEENSCVDCSDCQYRRQIAVLDSLPDTVVQAIQEACDQVNKGVINWLFRHKPMKLLSIMTIPYLLPIDITIVLFCKVWQQVPAIKKELKSSLYNLLNFLRSLLVKMESKRHLYSAKFSCQLAVTEFDYSNEDSPQVYVQSSNHNPRKVSNINLQKRKHSHNPFPKLEKAHSFSGKRNNQFVDIIKLKREQQQQLLQRKSYAGSEHSLHTIGIDRRKSMIEMRPKVKPPERLISKLNFGFTFDLKSNSQESEDFSIDSVDSEQSGAKVIDALKKFDEIDQNNAIDIANKALDWERECLEKYQEFGDNETNIDKMIEMTKKQDALMAFYYMDENNRVKVTEIFNISDQNSAEPEAQVRPNLDMDEDGDGLPELPQKSNTSPSIRRQSKSMLSDKSPAQRQRKKSVVLID